MTEADGDRPIRGHLREWVAASSVTLALAAAMTLDLVDGAVGRFFAHHGFFTSSLSGVLVLAVTVLVIDRIANIRRLRDRAKVMGTQAAMIAGQAARATRTLTDALDGSAERDAAGDQLRTFTMMLMLSAPVLMEATATRLFLEEAESLAGELARALAETRTRDRSDELDARLQAATDRLRAAAEPLLGTLSPAQQTAVGADAKSPPAPADGA